VNFAPYLIDVVLSGEIDPLRHKATVKDGELRVKLFKKVPGDMWGSFAVDVEDKEALGKAKADALVAHESLVQSLDEKRRDRRVEDERYSTRQQMKLDVSEPVLFTLTLDLCTHITLWHY
jgi:hypothetical protein